VLDISASQRLFGGRAALLKRLQQEGHARGWPRLGVSGTALGALAQARLSAARSNDQGTSEPDTNAPLDGLPLECLSASHPHRTVLNALGLRTLGDLRRCPRDGLARRTSPALLQALDQLYGKAPLILPGWQQPPRFQTSIELPAPTTDAGALAFATQRLLSRLVEWLRRHHQGVLHWQIAWPTPGATKSLEFRHRQPVQDGTLLLRLVQEALPRTVLATPVEELSLITVETAVWSPAQPGLLPGQSDSDALPWSALLERLSARLGERQVLAVQRRPDWDPAHRQQWRPALASADYTAAPTATGALAALWEPPWRLPQPRPLACGLGGAPMLDGQPVRRRLGPQRIATRWWDTPVIHEMCVVTTRDGRCWWLDRERDAASGRPSGWRLAGVYA